MKASKVFRLAAERIARKRADIGSCCVVEGILRRKAWGTSDAWHPATRYYQQLMSPNGKGGYLWMSDVKLAALEAGISKRDQRVSMLLLAAEVAESEGK